MEDGDSVFFCEGVFNSESLTLFDSRLFVNLPARSGRLTILAYAGFINGKVCYANFPLHSPLVVLPATLSGYFLVESRMMGDYHVRFEGQGVQLFSSAWLKVLRTTKPSGAGHPDPYINTEVPRHKECDKSIN